MKKSNVEQHRAKFIFSEKKRYGKIKGFWSDGWAADRYAQGWRGAWSGALLPKAESRQERSMNKVELIHSPGHILYGLQILEEHWKM